jgi:hypothetical protein
VQVDIEIKQQYEMFRKGVFDGEANPDQMASPTKPRVLPANPLQNLDFSHLKELRAKALNI